MKVELDTPDKPEIQRMAGILGIDPDAVVGKLFRVWAWFDKHTQNGHALGVTYSLLDRITCHAGFAEAMAIVGWLHQDGHDLALPNFDRHNGKTAKNRALSNERQKGRRGNVTQNVPILSRSERDKSVTREEKRREEKKETKDKKAQAPFVIPDWLSIEAWSGFTAMRIKSRKPMTDRAASLVIAELEKLKGEGHDPSDVLDQSTRNNWQDVYPVKARHGPAVNGSGSHDDYMRKAHEATKGIFDS